MVDHLNDRARRVMASADQEARKLNHSHFGSEHILLGLLKEDPAVAKLLRRFDLDFKKARTEVARLAPGLPHMVMIPRLPESPSAQLVFQHTLENARRQAHAQVSAEHLLAGLLDEHQGLAARVLANLGVPIDSLRDEAQAAMLAADVPHATPQAPAAAPVGFWARTSQAWRERLFRWGLRG